MNKKIVIMHIFKTDDVKNDNLLLQGEIIWNNWPEDKINLSNDKTKYNF